MPATATCSRVPFVETSRCVHGPGTRTARGLNGHNRVWLVRLDLGRRGDGRVLDPGDVVLDGLDRALGRPNLLQPRHGEKRQQPGDDQVAGGDEQERVRAADAGGMNALGGGDRDRQKREEPEESGDSEKRRPRAPRSWPRPSSRSWPAPASCRISRETSRDAVATSSPIVASSAAPWPLLERAAAGRLCADIATGFSFDTAVMNRLPAASRSHTRTPQATPDGSWVASLVVPDDATASAAGRADDPLAAIAQHPPSRALPLPTPAAPSTGC